jgi:hypothetical protein
MSVRTPSRSQYISKALCSNLRSPCQNGLRQIRPALPIACTGCYAVFYVDRFDTRETSSPLTGMSIRLIEDSVPLKAAAGKSRERLIRQRGGNDGGIIRPETLADIGGTGRLHSRALRAPEADR